ncbi:MAG: hypothetical protein ACKVQA_23700 [Burkholderiales bacterium]
MKLVLQVVTLLAMGWPGFAMSHGGLSMDEDICRLRVGPYNIHFVGYQPESSAEKEFCEDIPSTGLTIVVLDYVDQALRALPTEVRIILDTGSEENLDAITVLHMPPKIYPTGSVHFEHHFKEPGKFVGLVTVMDKQQLVARFPFSVAKGGSMGKVAVWIALALAFGAGLYFYTTRIRPRLSA